MKSFLPHATDLSRRRFVQGIAWGGAIAGLGRWRSAGAVPPIEAGRSATSGGSDVALDIGETPVDFTGAPRWATTVNGGIPGPTLRWREGDTVVVRVRNRLRVPTSIHWHGIVLPYDMDGVPGISFPGIAPGESFVYRFRLRQSGTYWYHAHSGFQEQTGLYGPLVIEPAGAQRHPADRDYVVMLNDWSDERPERIYAKLKKRSDYYDTARPTVLDFLRDARERGVGPALAERRMWDAMRMDPSDLSDVSGATYTYLMNGQPPAGNWTGLFRRGETIRLRIINGASMTIFDVRIPGLKLRVIAADGQDVEPLSVDELRIAPAETYDVLVEPEDERAYTLFAQAIDRSGFARGTLAPRPGMAADVPAMDPRVWLGMQDMMGAMPATGTQGHDAMPGMAMDGEAVAQSARGAPDVGADMRVATPRTRLDDPGTGLRDNGRRVLTYADLHTIGGPIDPREPGREIELRLTGNMERYSWSFDGVKFSGAAPLRFNSGERLRIVLINDTMMNHPIHLHGMWSELEAPDGAFLVRKHTVNVQPAQRVSYRVSADNPGRWAYHCHMLYHMRAGMMREVVVA